MSSCICLARFLLSLIRETLLNSSFFCNVPRPCVAGDTTAAAAAATEKVGDTRIRKQQLHIASLRLCRPCLRSWIAIGLICRSCVVMATHRLWPLLVGVVTDFLEACLRDTGRHFLWCTPRPCPRRVWPSQHPWEIRLLSAHGISQRRRRD